jgi:hypothetical protein
LLSALEGDAPELGLAIAVDPAVPPDRGDADALAGPEGPEEGDDGDRPSHPSGPACRDRETA